MMKQHILFFLYVSLFAAFILSALFIERVDESTSVTLQVQETEPCTTFSVVGTKTTITNCNIKGYKLFQIINTHNLNNFIY